MLNSKSLLMPNVLPVVHGSTSFGLTKSLLVVATLCWGAGFHADASAQELPQCEVWNKPINGCTDRNLDKYNLATTFAPSCDDHDRCYKTVGQTKDSCDYEFRLDTISDCEKQYIRPVKFERVSVRDCAISFSGLWKCFTSIVTNVIETTYANAEKLLKSPVYPVCLMTAEVYYQGVRTLGEANEAYKNAQASALGEAQRQARINERLLYETGVPCTITAEETGIFAPDDRESRRHRTVMDILSLDPNEPSGLKYEIASDIADGNGSHWQLRLISDIEEMRLEWLASEGISETIWANPTLKIRAQQELTELASLAETTELAAALPLAVARQDLMNRDASLAAVFGLLF